jgi:hypothetical protein
MFASLLSPPDALHGDGPHTLPDEVVRDLDITTLAQRVVHAGTTNEAVTAILKSLPGDRRTIEYRQEIVRQLWDSPALLAELSDSVDQMREITVFSRSGQESEQPLLDAVWRLGELELYVELVYRLRDALGSVTSLAPTSGLLHLREELDRRSTEATFRELAAALPDLRAGLKQHQSVTLGVNLDNRLRPVEAALLSINEKPFREAQFMAGFFGAAGADPFVTRTPLHSTPSGRSGDGHYHERLPLAPLFQEIATSSGVRDGQHRAVPQSGGRNRLLCRGDQPPQGDRSRGLPDELSQAAPRR